MKGLNQFFSFIILSILLCGCVSQDDYNQLQQDNTRLKEELDDIKFGPDKLLQQAMDYIENSQLDEAEIKLNLLISKHNGTKEARKGRDLLAKLSLLRSEMEDLNAWKLAEASRDITALENYKASHPNGKYIEKATEKIVALKIQNEQSAYNDAINQNSSVVWTKFIENYPKRDDISEIKKKIIRAEIAEIRGSDNVGALPSSYQTDYGYSDNSNILITNNTNYVLTVRYSGPEVISISIPAGGNRTIYLASGNYQVGATAGNASCGGTANLHGSYTSSYVITTSTYRSRY